MLGHPLAHIPNTHQACPRPPLQAQLLWQMKDGLCCLLLLRGAVQESLRGAPAARGRRGPLGAAGEEHGRQHLLAAEPSSGWWAKTA